MRQSMLVTIAVSGVVLLAGSPSSAQVSMNPDNPTIVIADGRINGGISLSAGTYYFRVPTTADNSYSFEVVDAVAARAATASPMVLTSGPASAACASQPKDTHLLPPGVGFVNARVSWRAAESGACAEMYTLQLTVPESSPSVTWTASDTTLYCAACDMSAAGATTSARLSFSNTTASAINARLMLFTDAAWNVAMDLTIQPKVGTVFEANPTTIPWAVWGAKLSHEGPPGAVLGEATLTDTSTGSVRSTRFEAVREIR